MSERVLHEWVDDKGRTWHLKNIPHRDATIPWAYRYGPDGSCESSDGGACVDELARLASRVAELEGKNAKLRACVEKAADVFRHYGKDVFGAPFFTDRHGDSERCLGLERTMRDALNAARAEVDK